MTSRALPLRLKLTFWYLLVFSGIQLGLLLVVGLLRRGESSYAFDEEISRSAEAMVENLLVTEFDWRVDELGALVPTDSRFVICALRDESGGILASWNVAEPESLPFSELEAVPAGPLRGVFSSMGADEGERLTGAPAVLRTLTSPFRWGGGLYFLQVAVRDDLLQRMLGPLLDMLRIGVPVATIAALIAAWLIAGRAVAPIRRLSDAARAVSPENLAEPIRFPTTDGEVRGLQRDLNAALERLRERYEAQEQFISNVSHELKTPIAVLLTESQVVKIGAPDARRYAEFVDRVEEEMQQLGRLVESFLEITRSEITREELREPVPINDLVLDAVRDCRASATRSGVSLVPNLPAPGEAQIEPHVPGDALLLRTLLDNLIRNAIRHAPFGSPVDVDASCTGDEVVLVVRDRGPGIPEEYLDRVFERFVQVPHDGRPEPGTGLGLSIARNIVRLHGGTIEAANRRPSGSTFTVRLPQMAVEPEAAAG